MWKRTILRQCGQKELYCGNVDRKSYIAAMWTERTILRQCGQKELYCGNVDRDSYIVAMWTERAILRQCGQEHPYCGNVDKSYIVAMLTERAILWQCGQKELYCGNGKQEGTGTSFIMMCPFLQGYNVTMSTDFVTRLLDGVWTCLIHHFYRDNVNSTFQFTFSTAVTLSKNSIRIFMQLNKLVNTYY